MQRVGGGGICTGVPTEHEVGIFVVCKKSYIALLCPLGTHIKYCLPIVNILCA